MLNRMQGITLIEMLVVVLIAAVLVTVATPSFKRLVDQSRLSGVTRHYVSALRTARHNAIDTGHVTRLYPNDHHDFSSGWSVSDDQGFARHWTTPDNIAISAHFGAQGDMQTVYFHADGFPRTASEQRLSGNAIFCLAGFANRVFVSVTGRIQEQACDDCNCSTQS